MAQPVGHSHFWPVAHRVGSRAFTALTGAWGTGTHKVLGLVLLPPFSLTQLRVFSGKFEKSFQVLNWKSIFDPLFRRTLKSQSYFSVHVSGTFCCLSDFDIRLKRPVKQELWDSVFLHMWKYHSKHLHFQRVLFISSELRVCFVHNLKPEKNIKRKQCNAERLRYLRYYPCPS